MIFRRLIFPQDGSTIFRQNMIPRARSSLFSLGLGLLGVALLVLLLPRLVAVLIASIFLTGGIACLGLALKTFRFGRANSKKAPKNGVWEVVE